MKISLDIKINRKNKFQKYIFDNKSFNVSIIIIHIIYITTFHKQNSMYLLIG